MIRLTLSRETDPLFRFSSSIAMVCRGPSHCDALMIANGLRDYGRGQVLRNEY